MLWEKEKMLITSIFSFCPSVFKRSIPQDPEKQVLFGNGLTKILLERARDILVNLLSSAMTYLRQMLTSTVHLTLFLNKCWFLHVCSTSLYKPLLKTEKLLITSNFSFSHSVFSPLVQTFLPF